MAFRSNPLNDDTTDGQWCAQRGIRIEELRSWQHATPQAAQQILEDRRARYHAELMAVDAALLQKAKEGDTKAADLLYRRFENWTPKMADEALKRNPTSKSFAELVAEEDV